MFKAYLVLAVTGLQALAAPSPIPVEPKVSLPFALRLGELSTTLVEHDRARALGLKASAQRGGSTLKRRSVFNAAATNTSFSVLNQFVSYHRNCKEVL